MASRRQFLTTGSKVALAASLLPSLVLDRTMAWASPVTPANKLTPATFRGLERSSFTVRSGWNKTKLKLVTVGKERVQRVPGTGTIRDFSLIFKGPASSVLDQETYRFEHKTLGSFDLFLVPMNSAGTEQHYQVVFNQLHA